MVYAGRAAGVCIRMKACAIPPLFIVADNEVARDQVNLFPILMNKGLGSENARLKAQKTSAASAFSPFIERPRKNFLLDALGIARWNDPSLGHVE